ncbi:MAG: hypothetical protein HWQ35_16435 [Nostoc sp. NMS1]|uniref:hypothetical protein n=1 Tax=unclassified Nostoc TaxID=2593658 RepID=UPI0025EB49F1|nr:MULTISPECIES: hypothetical protein [unclassified Nostoc]MBN3908079.1 hypothetical protein [Nostoc sp. NMS1]MBN3990599.1 hypothetical protein [Nostoc sp. NMS2]
MKQIRKQALFATFLFSNISLSSVSSLVLDKYLHNSLTDNNRDSANLLNSNAKAISSSSFEPVVGIKLPPIKLRWPSVKWPQIKPPRPPIKPPKLTYPNPFKLPHLKFNYQQVSLQVSQAMSEAKKKQATQTLLNDMPSLHAISLEQRMTDDITTKIQSQLLIYDLPSHVQNLSDQAFQEAAQNYYSARDAAFNLLASRYAKKGVLTSLDEQDAQLAAQQAIQEQRRHKILVLSGVTTTTIAGIAVASATSRVQANNNKRT